MNKKIFNTFDSIKTDEEFKSAALNYVMQHTGTARKRNFIPRIAAVIIVLLCFFSLRGISYSLYTTPASYVDIDVNPSIELVINRFGRVIETYAYNEDAALLESRLNLRHKSYDQAVTLLLDAMVQDGYLADESLISVTVNTGSDKNDILETVDEKIQSLLVTSDISAERDVYSVDDDIKNHAHSLDLSPAKYLAILALQEVDDTISIDECKDHSIKELHDFRQSRSEHHDRKTQSQENDLEKNSSGFSDTDTDDPPKNNNHHNNSHDK